MRDLKGYYDIPDLGPNVKYPSVTKIIGVLDKFLDTWKVGLDIDYFYDNSVGPFIAGDLPLEQFLEINWPKLIADAKLYHKDVSNEAMDFGSRFHKVMDDWHKGTEGGCETDLAECVKSTIEWEESVYLKPIESEGIVFSEVFKYAGTRDLKAEIRLNTEPLTCVLDYKTRNGKNGKRIPVYPSDKEQIAAYINADEEMNKTRLDYGGVIIINRETNKVEPHLFPRVDLIRPFDSFRCLVEYFYLSRMKP
jgi:hypothetical protein